MINFLPRSRGRTRLMLGFIIAVGVCASWTPRQLPMVAGAQAVQAEIRGAATDGRVASAGIPYQITPSFFQRQDLLYGSSLGSWAMQDGRYDGQYMLNYNDSCPACVQLARDAEIPVVAWAVWDTFSDQLNPSGNYGTMTDTQFNNVIDGIRNTLGAAPFIKLQPGNSANTFCPDRWSLDDLLAMDEEIVRTAGSRVQLYEVVDEAELACEYAPGVAGKNIGQLWIKTVPKLKKLARSLGFEIYVGGPATTTTNIGIPTDSTDLLMIADFLRVIRSEYNNPASQYYHDPDLIPSFVSFHAYGIEYVNLIGGNSTPLDALPRYGAFIDAANKITTNIWGDVAPDIKMVVSEWNIGAAATVNYQAYPFPEPLTSQYYTQFLQVLRQHHVFMALQFLVGSDDSGMNMITKIGTDTPYYESFKAQSLSDPLAVQSRIDTVQRMISRTILQWIHPLSS